MTDARAPIPAAVDLPPLAEGTVVYIHAPADTDLPCRWGIVERVHGTPRTGADAAAFGPPHAVRLDDGILTIVSATLLCPPFALPVSDHCRGRWDFHPPAPRIM